MKSDFTLFPNHAVSLEGNTARMPTLAERTQAAVNALRHAPSPAEAIDFAKRDDRKSSGEVVFRFYVASSVSLHRDSDEEEWKLPEAIPMYVDLVLHRAVPKPPPPKPVDARSYALNGSEHAVGRCAKPTPADIASAQADSRATSTRSGTEGQRDRMRGLHSTSAIRQTGPSGTTSASTQTAHAVKKSARLPASLRADVTRLRKAPPPEAPPELAPLSDVQVATLELKATRWHRARDDERNHKPQTSQSDNDTESPHAVPARVPQPSFASAAFIPENNTPEAHSPARTLRQFAPRMQQAPAEKANNEAAEHSDTYEVTYRFTSWSHDASVKLKLNTSQHATRSVIATPSDSRVHNVLRTDLGKVTASAASKADAPPVLLDAPTVPFVDSDEQDGQRRGKPRIVVDEEAQ